jgi:hypothetical protein
VVDEGPMHDQGVALYRISAFRINKPVADEGPSHDQGVTSLRVFTTIGTVGNNRSRAIRKQSYVNGNDRASKKGWA